MKIYCDNIVVNSLSRKDLDALIMSGKILLFDETVVDARILQNNYSWTKRQLKRGTIQIELWNSLDEMTQKPFFWSSKSIATLGTYAFSEAINFLPNNSKIRNLARLVRTFGIPRKEWTSEQKLFLPVLDSNIAQELGLNPTTASRSEFFIAASEKKMLQYYSKFFNSYNYLLTLALLHNCDGFLKNDDKTYGIEI